MQIDILSYRLLTHAMGTRALAVTLGSQLVTLITGAADPAPNGPRGAVHASPARGAGTAIGVLAMAGILTAELGALVDVDLLLELLEGVLGAVGEGVEAGAVEVAGGIVVGEHVGGGEGVVGGEAVQRVRQHLDDEVDEDEEEEDGDDEVGRGASTSEGRGRQKT